jgi:hypothetical protein
MSTNKVKPVRCLLDVRSIPLECFKHPRDGARKWRQPARHRYELLFKLSSWADPDGRCGAFSPSFKTLQQHYSRSTLYLHMDDLNDLGFLTWARKDHYHKREYQILIPEAVQKQVQDSGATEENQVQHSGENQVQDLPEQVQDSENQVHDSQITGPTTGKTGPNYEHHPSLPSFPIPSNTSVQPQAEGGQGALPENLGQGKTENGDVVESMAEIFGDKNLPDIRSGLGSKNSEMEIRERAAEDGDDIVREAWKHYLEKRNFQGMTAPAVYWFLQEYPEWKAKVAAIVRKADSELKAENEFKASQTEVADWLSKLTAAPNIDIYVAANPAPLKRAEVGSKWTIQYVDDAIEAEKKRRAKELEKYQEEMAGVPY